MTAMLVEAAASPSILSRPLRDRWPHEHLNCSAGQIYERPWLKLRQAAPNTEQAINVPALLAFSVGSNIKLLG